MHKIGSAINIHDASAKENYAHQQQLKAQVIGLRERASEGGSARAKERHRSRGKYLARERIERLIDPGTPFFEIGKVAGEGVYPDPLPSAAIVTGLGYVNDSLVAIYANDATVKGGSYYPLTAKKTRRVQELAMQLGIPSVYMMDSGGVNLETQDGLFPDEHTLGEVFKYVAQMSAARLPQIGAVMGTCPAAAAYIPALCDEAVITDKTGALFLGGPELVEAATGVVVDAQTLGGAALHAKVSGVVDHVGATEDDTLLIIRSIISRHKTTSHGPSSPPFAPSSPRFSAHELPYLVPNDPARKQLDMFEILARVVDDSHIDQFKAHYGTSIICATAKIGGYPVGIVANNGLLYEDSSAKAAHFIEICCQRDIPLLYLHDIRGFMIGEKYEASGIARQGSKMVHAVANASVPKLVLILGSSYGAGYMAMCPRTFDPLLMGIWPGARMSVVGADQAASVMAMMATKQLVSAGKPVPTEEEQEKFKQPIIDSYNKQASALNAATRLWVDDVVLPEETREWLINGLRLATMVPARNPAFGVFRM